LPRRVNGDLTLEFGDERLTPHSGLELLARRLRELNVNQLVRESFRGIHFCGDYGIVMLVRPSRDALDGRSSPTPCPLPVARSDGPACRWTPGSS